MSVRSSNKSPSPWDEIIASEKLHTLQENEMTVDTYSRLTSLPKATAGRRLDSLVRQRKADVKRMRMQVGNRVQYINVYTIRK